MLLLRPVVQTTINKIELYIYSINVFLLILFISV